MADDGSLKEGVALDLRCLDLWRLESGIRFGSSRGQARSFLLLSQRIPKVGVNEAVDA